MMDNFHSQELFPNPWIAVPNNTVRCRLQAPPNRPKRILPRTAISDTDQRMEGDHQTQPPDLNHNICYSTTLPVYSSLQTQNGQNSYIMPLIQRPFISSAVPLSSPLFTSNEIVISNPVSMLSHSQPQTVANFPVSITAVEPEKILTQCQPEATANIHASTSQPVQSCMSENQSTKRIMIIQPSQQSMLTAFQPQVALSLPYNEVQPNQQRLVFPSELVSALNNTNLMHVFAEPNSLVSHPVSHLPNQSFMSVDPSQSAIGIKLAMLNSESETEVSSTMKVIDSSSDQNISQAEVTSIESNQESSIDNHCSADQLMNLQISSTVSLEETSNLENICSSNIQSNTQALDPELALNNANSLSSNLITMSTQTDEAEIHTSDWVSSKVKNEKSIQVDGDLCVSENSGNLLKSQLHVSDSTLSEKNLVTTGKPIRIGIKLTRSDSSLSSSHIGELGNWNAEVLCSDNSISNSTTKELVDDFTVISTISDSESHSQTSSVSSVITNSVSHVGNSCFGSIKSNNASIIQTVEDHPITAESLEKGKSEISNEVTQDGFSRNSENNNINTIAKGSMLMESSNRMLYNVTGFSDSSTFSPFQCGENQSLNKIGVNIASSNSLTVNPTIFNEPACDSMVYGTSILMNLPSSSRFLTTECATVSTNAGITSYSVVSNSHNFLVSGNSVSVVSESETAKMQSDKAINNHVNFNIHTKSCLSSDTLEKNKKKQIKESKSSKDSIKSVKSHQIQRKKYYKKRKKTSNSLNSELNLDSDSTKVTQVEDGTEPKLKSSNFNTDYADNSSLNAQVSTDLSVKAGCSVTPIITNSLSKADFNSNLANKTDLSNKSSKDFQSCVNMELCTTYDDPKQLKNNTFDIEKSASISSQLLNSSFTINPNTNHNNYDISKNLEVGPLTNVRRRTARKKTSPLCSNLNMTYSSSCKNIFHSSDVSIINNSMSLNKPVKRTRLVKQKSKRIASKKTGSLIKSTQYTRRIKQRRKKIVPKRASKSKNYFGNLPGVLTRSKSNSTLSCTRNIQLSSKKIKLAKSKNNPLSHSNKNDVKKTKFVSDKNLSLELRDLKSTEVPQSSNDLHKLNNSVVELLTSTAQTKSSDLENSSIKEGQNDHSADKDVNSAFHKELSVASNLFEFHDISNKKHLLQSSQLSGKKPFNTPVKFFISKSKDQTIPHILIKKLPRETKNCSVQTDSIDSSSVFKSTAENISKINTKTFDTLTSSHLLTKTVIPIDINETSAMQETQSSITVEKVHEATTSKEFLTSSDASTKSSVVTTQIQRSVSLKSPSMSSETTDNGTSLKEVSLFKKSRRPLSCKKSSEVFIPQHQNLNTINESSKVCESFAPNHNSLRLHSSTNNSETPFQYISEGSTLSKTLKSCNNNHNVSEVKSPSKIIRIKKRGRPPSVKKLTPCEASTSNDVSLSNTMVESLETTMPQHVSQTDNLPNSTASASTAEISISNNLSSPDVLFNSPQAVPTNQSITSVITSDSSTHPNKNNISDDKSFNAIQTKKRKRSCTVKKTTKLEHCKLPNSKMSSTVNKRPTSNNSVISHESLLSDTISSKPASADTLEIFSTNHMSNEIISSVPNKSSNHINECNISNTASLNKLCVKKRGSPHSHCKKLSSSPCNKVVPNTSRSLLIPPVIENASESPTFVASPNTSELLSSSGKLISSNTKDTLQAIPLTEYNIAPSAEFTSIPETLASRCGTGKEEDACIISSINNCTDFPENSESEASEANISQSVTLIKDPALSKTWITFPEKFLGLVRKDACDPVLLSDNKLESPAYETPLLSSVDKPFPLPVYPTHHKSPIGIGVNKSVSVNLIDINFNNELGAASTNKSNHVLSALELSNNSDTKPESGEIIIKPSSHSDSLELTKTVAVSNSSKKPERPKRLKKVSAACELCGNLGSCFYYKSKLFCSKLCLKMYQISVQSHSSREAHQTHSITSRKFGLVGHSHKTKKSLKIIRSDQMKRYSCEILGCTKSYMYPQSLKKHKRKVHDTNMNVNERLKNTGDKNEELPYHLSEEDNSLNDSNRTNQDNLFSFNIKSQKRYSCKISGCTKKFIKLKSLQKHMKIVHDSNSFVKERHEVPDKSEKSSEKQPCHQVNSMDCDINSNNSGHIDLPNLSNSDLKPKNNSEVNFEAEIKKENIGSLIFCKKPKVLRKMKTQANKKFLGWTKKTVMLTVECSLCGRFFPHQKYKSKDFCSLICRRKYKEKPKIGLNEDRPKRVIKRKIDDMEYYFEDSELAIMAVENIASNDKKCNKSSIKRTPSQAVTKSAIQTCRSLKSKDYNKGVMSGVVSNLPNTSVDKRKRTKVRNTGQKLHKLNLKRTAQVSTIDTVAIDIHPQNNELTLNPIIEMSSKRKSAGNKTESNINSVTFTKENVVKSSNLMEGSSLNKTKIATEESSEMLSQVLYQAAEGSEIVIIGANDTDFSNKELITNSVKEVSSKKSPENEISKLNFNSETVIKNCEIHSNNSVEINSLNRKKNSEISSSSFDTSVNQIEKNKEKTTPKEGNEIGISYGVSKNKEINFKSLKGKGKKSKSVPNSNLETHFDKHTLQSKNSVKSYDYSNNFKSNLSSLTFAEVSTRQTCHSSKSINYNKEKYFKMDSNLQNDAVNGKEKNQENEIVEDNEVETELLSLTTTVNEIDINTTKNKGSQAQKFNISYVKAMSSVRKKAKNEALKSNFKSKKLEKKAVQRNCSMNSNINIQDVKINPNSCDPVVNKVTSNNEKTIVLGGVSKCANVMRHHCNKRRKLIDKVSNVNTRFSNSSEAQEKQGYKKKIHESISGNTCLNSNNEMNSEPTDIYSKNNKPTSSLHVFEFDPSEGIDDSDVEKGYDRKTKDGKSGNSFDVRTKNKNSDVKASKTKLPFRQPFSNKKKITRFNASESKRKEIIDNVGKCAVIKSRRKPKVISNINTEVNKTISKLNIAENITPFKKSTKLVTKSNFERKKSKMVITTDNEENSSKIETEESCSNIKYNTPLKSLDSQCERAEVVTPEIKGKRNERIELHNNATDNNEVTVNFDKLKNLGKNASTLGKYPVVVLNLHECTSEISSNNCESTASSSLRKNHLYSEEQFALSCNRRKNIDQCPKTVAKEKESVESNADIRKKRKVLLKNKRKVNPNVSKIYKKTKIHKETSSSYNKGAIENPTNATASSNNVLPCEDNHRECYSDVKEWLQFDSSDIQDMSYNGKYNTKSSNLESEASCSNEQLDKIKIESVISFYPAFILKEYLSDLTQKYQPYVRLIRLKEEDIQKALGGIDQS